MDKFKINAFREATDAIFDAARKKGRKMTQSELADRIGSEQWQVASWRTRSEPPETAIESLCKAFPYVAHFFKNAQSDAHFSEDDGPYPPPAGHTHRSELDAYKSFVLSLYADLYELKANSSNEMGLAALQDVERCMNALFKKYLKR